MSDFLATLVGRTLGGMPSAQPLVPPRYAPVAALPATPWEAADSAQSEGSGPSDPGRAALARPAPLGQTPLASTGLGNTAEPTRPLLQPVLRQRAEQRNQPLFPSPEIEQPAAKSRDRVMERVQEHEEEDLVQPFSPDAEIGQPVNPPTQRAPEQPPFLLMQAQPQEEWPARSVTQREGYPPAARQAESAMPTIQVTIGRVEVRAVQPSAASTQRQPTGPAAKRSLEEYLRTSNSGGQSGGQRGEE